jgi:hypothetical protein
MGWKPEDLTARRKGDPRKVKLALRLRAETAVTVKWLARTITHPTTNCSAAARARNQEAPGERCKQSGNMERCLDTWYPTELRANTVIDILTPSIDLPDADSTPF